MCDGIDKTAASWCLESAEELKETITENSSPLSIVPTTTESIFSKESFSTKAKCPRNDEEEIVVKGTESSLSGVSDHGRENSNKMDNENGSSVVDDKSMTEAHVSEDVFTAEEYVDGNVTQSLDEKNTMDAEVENKESFSTKAKCPRNDEEEIVVKGTESSLSGVSDPGRENSNKMDNENGDSVVDDKSMTEARVSEDVFTAEEYVDGNVTESLDEENTMDAEVENKDTFSAEVSMEEQYRDEQRYIKYNFAVEPQQVTGAWQEFSESSLCFLKGCKWSPDGSCIVTASDDNVLRIFNLPVELYTGTTDSHVPEMVSAVKILEGETIYDYAWYPYMSSLDPDTCCLLSSSRDHPVHMWDAFNGSLRCSYRPYDQMDEIASPNCVAFNLDGSQIFCGFNNMVRVFNTARPGRECQNRLTVVKKSGQHGIISCISFCSDFSGIYALGSYSRTVGVYSDTGELLCLLQGQTGGVTQVMFSQDGTKLYSGGRKDEEILCWDIRNPGRVVHRLLRSVTTNQRMYMDMDRSGRYVISGSSDGCVSVWDTCSSPIKDVDDTQIPTLSPTLNYTAHGDCVNGVSLHPSLPLLATASGQRKFPTPGGSDSSDEDTSNSELHTDNSLRVWALSTY